RTFGGRRKYIPVGCGRGVLPRTPPKAPSCARVWARRLAAVALSSLVALAATSATVVAAAPAGGTPLDAYLDNLRTLRATFLQTLADAHGHEIARASGTLIVVRPGKFSWDIHPLAPAGGRGRAA